MRCVRTYVRTSLYFPVTHKKSILVGKKSEGTLRGAKPMGWAHEALRLVLLKRRER